MFKKISWKIKKIILLNYKCFIKLYNELVAEKYKIT